MESFRGYLPKKEADPYIDDFKYAGKVRQMIRTYYEGVGHSLRSEGKKVQQLIDDHIRSLNVSELMNPRKITYDNFLSYVSNKFKSQRARTALVKNKASQVIKELGPNNPVYYEKLRERLEKIIYRKTKTSSRKRMGIIIYDILTENKFPDGKVDELTQKIIDLAERKTSV